MQAKEAITLAKQYVMELFDEEKISDLGLEEVTQDGEFWDVTIGFSRPWDAKVDAHSIITGTASRTRAFKAVKIRDSDGRLAWIRNRA